MSAEISVTMEGHVAILALCRPPNNFIDTLLTGQIADALERLDEAPACRAVVLAAEGKHFCAGADFSQANRRAGDADASGRTIYTEGVRLLRSKKPIVAAVQGAAIGAGLGLAASGFHQKAHPDRRPSRADLCVAQNDQPHWSRPKYLARPIQQTRLA